MNKDLILRERLALQRTILANQSTFLAFLRTSMYFLVAGVSLNNLKLIQNGQLVENIFIVIAFVLLIIGIINFVIQNKKIKKSEIHIGNYKFEYENDKH